LEKPVKHTVRNYQKGDEFALAKIYSECFGPVAPGRVRQWHRRPGFRSEDVFIGMADGKLVSHVDVEFKQLHHGEGVHIKTAGIGGVCTDSDYRKKGIVTNLMKLALEHGQQVGVSNASLFTDLDIPAHRIYERFGFVDVVTWRTYTRIVDYPFIFTRWLRYLNRSLKYDKIAAKKIAGWEKSVAIQLKEIGTLSFRFRKGRFQKLKKPSKRVDVEFSSDVQTYAKILRGVVQWEDAVVAKKLTLKRGEAADIEMLKRILRWRWED